MAHAYVFGLVGPACTSEARTTWNRLLNEQGIDGFFDFYRTKSRGELELRLSEMFLLQRRGYIIAPSLGKDAASLMDRLDASAERGVVDIVKNEGGVLVGYFLKGASDEEILQVFMK